MSTLPTSVTNTLENVQKRLPSFDAVMFFDVFLFFMSFCVLAFEKDGDKVFAARSWLWYFNALFIIDLFFRLLSLHIESIKREYWNPVLPCIFTIIIWMVTAFYDFDDVFGSKPTQGFNVFLFILYHIGLVGYLVLKRLYPNNDQTTG